MYIRTNIVNILLGRAVAKFHVPVKNVIYYLTGGTGWHDFAFLWFAKNIISQ